MSLVRSRDELRCVMSLVRSQCALRCVMRLVGEAHWLFFLVCADLCCDQEPGDGGRQRRLRMQSDRRPSVFLRASGRVGWRIPVRKKTTLWRDRSRPAGRSRCRHRRRLKNDRTVSPAWSGTGGC